MVARVDFVTSSDEMGTHITIAKILAGQQTVGSKSAACGPHSLLERAMIRVLLSTCALGACAASVLVAPAAQADQSNSPQAETVSAVCDGTPVTATVVGNGDFTPAFMEGGKGVFIPYQFEFTSAQGTQTLVKKAPLPSDYTTCTAVIDDFTLVVKGVVRPQG